MTDDDIVTDPIEIYAAAAIARAFEPEETAQVFWAAFVQRFERLSDHDRALVTFKILNFAIRKCGFLAETN